VTLVGDETCAICCLDRNPISWHHCPEIAAWLQEATGAPTAFDIADGVWYSPKPGKPFLPDTKGSFDKRFGVHRPKGRKR
jgi:hypothetical protein